MRKPKGYRQTGAQAKATRMTWALRCADGAAANLLHCLDLCHEAPPAVRAKLRAVAREAETAAHSLRITIYREAFNHGRSRSSRR